MNSKKVSVWNIFFKLVGMRLLIIRQQLFDKVFNLYIWGFCTLVIMGHVMQAFGLSGNFGIFQLAGVIATAGLFEMYGNVAMTIMDFEGDRSIEYYLTLPTTPSVILASTACAYAIMGTTLSFIVIPLGKVIFWNSFDLTAVAWLKLAGVVTIANIFYGMLTQAVAAHVGSMRKMGNVWARFIFPLWFLGGFQFSWKAMNKLSEAISYVLLVNPITYIMEGTRAAVIGQADFLSWWACIGALSLFSFGCWFYAYYKMKKLLDFV